MKATIAVLLLIVFGLVYENSATTSTFGTIIPYDTLLFQEKYTVKSQLLRSANREVQYPPLGMKNPRLITAIRAVDNEPKKSGNAVIMKGGPGKRFVTLQLKSGFNDPLDFTVEIYGRSSR